MDEKKIVGVFKNLNARQVVMQMRVSTFNQVSIINGANVQPEEEPENPNLHETLANDQPINFT